ncbi:MAG: ABC transporter ATP-binding protein/permease [Fluviicola sp.]|jgi:ABC-type bacteriocin/lantibiotic exporter with double-glycine peptidase domain|nr:ABC transporter ATP-binding protein/permease [Fluviicola sp.]
MDSFSKLWQLILGEKKEIGSIYFYAILNGFVQLMIPIGIQAIIGLVLGGTMITSMYILIFLIVFGVLAGGLMQINQMKIIEKIQQKIFTKYAFAFTDKLEKIDINKNHNGYLPDKVTKFFDAINLQKGVSKILLDIPAATIQIVFGLLLLMIYHNAFIVFSVFLIVILWSILKFTSKKGLTTSLTESKYKYAVAGWIIELARNINSLRLSKNDEFNYNRTDKNLVGYLQARNNHFKVLMLQYKTLVVFKVAITAAMLSVGTVLLINQKINIGEFIASEIVILMVIGAVEKLISSLDVIYDILTAIEKLDSVLDLKNEKTGEIELKKDDLTISLKDVSFQYENGKLIVSDINQTINKGDKICIYGEPQVGKSTLLKILGFHYLDYKGNLLINSIPQKNYYLNSLRKATSYFSINNNLFLGTLWENISLGNNQLDHNELIKITHELGYDSILNEFNQGFETIIEPEGNAISNSTKIKILILRAIANQSIYTLLDEPFKHLNEDETDKLINYINTQKDSTFIVTTKIKNIALQFEKNWEIKNEKIIQLNK